MDSILSFRFLLLVIGALIVAGVYLWGSRGQQRNARIKVDKGRTRFKPRRTSDTRVDEAPAAEKPVARGVARHDDSDIEIPAITKEGAGPKPKPPRLEKPQMELSFDAQSAAPPPRETVEPAIIALFVRSPAGHEFAGPAIVAAMNAVGLRYGDMDIFITSVLGN